jgi:hypothetical protein
MQTTYTIPTENKPALKAKLEKIQRRANKLELTAIEFSFSSAYYRDGADGLKDHVIDVSITGETVKIAGWSFCATLDHFSDPDQPSKWISIVKAVSGCDVPERFRSIGPICEHCSQSRKRTQTYVLKHDDGSRKAVGSSCLRDFLGGHDPHAAVLLCNDLIQAQQACEESMGGSRGHSAIDIDRFLAVTAAIVRIDGYVSSAKARESLTPVYRTSDALQDYFFSPAQTDEEKKWKALREPTEIDIATAEKAKQWALSLHETAIATLNDYQYNIANIARIGVVELRLIGLAVSIVPSYQRAVGADIERQKARESSVHFGTVGERSVYALTVTKILTTESQWGTTFICKFVDENGNFATWFASKRVDFAVGEKVTVKGTVKEHKEYQGIKETVLTRCTVTKAA